MEDKKNQRRAGVSDLSFSFEALMAEVDQLRPTVRFNMLTQEQRRFILRCRDHSNPLSYPNMAKLWEKAGWGRINSSTLQYWYDEHKTELKS